MKTFRTVILTVAIAILAACSATPKKPMTAAAPPPPPAAALNVAGNWVLTIDSQAGSQDTKLALLQTGKDLSGTFDSPMGKANCKGTIDGKDIKIGFPFSAQGTELQIDFIGTTDGQTMSGRAVFGSFGEGTFKAKRL